MDTSRAQSKLQPDRSPQQHHLLCTNERSGLSLTTSMQAYLVVCTSQLKAEHRLHVFSLDQDAIPHEVTELFGLLQGCLHLQHQHQQHSTNRPAIRWLV
eukprot:452221-Pelagomonas_calceolata.AAC.1